MNDVELQILTNYFKYDSEGIALFIYQLLEKMSINNWSFSVVFCNDEYIMKLNDTYRHKNEPTDVLTFCEHDVSSEWVDGDEKKRFYAGDIVISVDTLKKNALYFHVEEKEEVKRLIIHGILHLSGLDHKSNNPDEEMLVYQEKLLTDLGEFEF